MILPTMTNAEISREINKDLCIVQERVFNILNKYRKLANKSKPKERMIYLN